MYVYVHMYLYAEGKYGNWSYKAKALKDWLNQIKV